MGNFQTCGPNEAMVLYGCCNGTIGVSGQPTYVTGGRLWVWAGGFQRLQKISLETISLEIRSKNVYTKLGVPVSVVGVARIKVDGMHEQLEKAASLFLGKPPSAIQDLALKTMEGHQRSIIGNLTVEDIIKDRKQFGKLVFTIAKTDLAVMGLQVVSYTLKDIRDDQGYLQALGKTRTAEVKRDADIGEAESKRDAGIKMSIANEAQMSAKYQNDILKEKAKRDFEVKKAGYELEVQTEKAKAKLAYELQAARSKQAIKQAEMEVKVEERAKSISVQDQEVLRREKELEAQVKKPAEAERYRLETIAEAERKKVILEAEAKAEAICLKGEAKAFSIEAKAKAIAEQMTKKAEAWKEYQEAAVVDMVLEVLPKVVAEVAAPLTKVKKVTIVSSGKGDIGAAKLTEEVIDVVDKLPGMVEKLTGVSILKQIKQS